MITPGSGVRSRSAAAASHVGLAHDPRSSARYGQDPASPTPGQDRYLRPRSRHGVSDMESDARRQLPHRVCVHLSRICACVAGV
eukprot:82045-Rhodomonas_salina.5